MQDATPEITREYKNHHLDSTRWQLYRPRAGDIIVSTSYKSGTTWAQMILYWLLQGDPAQGPQLGEVSPWVDARFMGISRDDLAARLEGLPGRRFLKTHLPLDGLPYYPEVSYVIVGRDPRDVFMSLFNHYLNYTEIAYSLLNDPNERVGDELPRCPEEPRELWRQWMTRGWFPWESEGYPFWANLAHSESYWRYRQLPNFVFLHYADMLQDLEGSIRRLAGFLKIDVSEDRLARVVEQNTFAAVKKNADEKPPDEDQSRMMFKGGLQSFFFKGSNGRWRGVLTEEDLALYEATKKRVLSPACAAWLEQGEAAGFD